MKAFFSCKPSSQFTAVGWFAKPASYSAWYKKSPERSPVNIRPVRFEPCAPGANPRINSSAWGSPKAGTGLPQYSQSRNARRFSRATFSRYATSRGHFRHSIISFSSIAKGFLRSVIAVRVYTDRPCAGEALNREKEKLFGAANQTIGFAPGNVVLKKRSVIAVFSHSHVNFPQPRHS